MNKFIQSRLLLFAAVFLLLQTIIITLAPAVRARSWDVEYRFTHWIAFGLWALFTARAHYDITRKIPDADPYLFPAAAFISGWGILTIWRLAPDFGARQAVWFSVSLGILILGTRLPNMELLRRYKYILLTGGLILTALTLIFGTNPSGSGPRLWLGYEDLYLQPSEPLKFLLIGYLAAYLADRLPARLRTIHILYPTIVLSGIVILLLVVQRDFGTAAIFTALYTIIIYLATGRKRIMLIALVMLAVVSVAGYSFVGIVQARVNSWINPWIDPAGSSYQIIQSLIAIANGGILGTGPGLGSPEYIPVALSDFVYAAIAEETGLFGTLGLLALISLILARGLRAALRAPDTFRRILAAGIVTYFGIQTILIVGGNLRLLPITGVTLPFVSYGGSSLVTSFVALLILLHISNHQDADPAPLPKPQPYMALGTFLALGLFACALANGWWSVVRGPDLLTRTDNARRSIEERYVLRGDLLDRSNSQINTNRGEVGTYTRSYKYPDLASITGYTNPRYGQAGLEASLDEYLRGIKGNPTSAIVWNELLYGMHPEGLDVRLSLDLYLQYRADEMLHGRKGAVIMMNAQSGEILAMASHPTFNPADLNNAEINLLNDPDKPLVNRATQGQYLTGTTMEPFIQAMFGEIAINESELREVYETFGFYRAPQLQLPVAPAAVEGTDLPRVSPLQMALACAALTYQGILPAPRIAMAVNTPTEGWISLPALGTPVTAIQATAGNEAVLSRLADDRTYWWHVGTAEEPETSVTWFIGGTPPNWQAAPLVVVVVLEENNERLARRIGRELLIDALNP